MTVIHGYMGMQERGKGRKEDSGSKGDLSKRRIRKLKSRRNRKIEKKLKPRSRQREDELLVICVCHCRGAANNRCAERSGVGPDPLRSTYTTAQSAGFGQQRPSPLVAIVTALPVSTAFGLFEQLVVQFPLLLHINHDDGLGSRRCGLREIQ